MMSTYEIEIYNMQDDTEMNTVQEALQKAGIAGEDVDGVGMYLQDDKPRSVFVDPSDVAEAVEILNGLGYETDEDELEDEEFEFDGE